MRLNTLTMTAVAATLALVAVSAPAQNRGSYPLKPIRMLSGQQGSPSDIMARTLAPLLSERWGQPVVIENRPGAAGMIASNIVAKAPADGYTLLLISAQFAILAALNSNLPYDPLKDFAGVTQLSYSTSALLIPPSLGTKTLKDFVTYAQARPDKIFFSSGGAGSSTHINAERFRYAAGIKAVHVGFKGTPEALLEVLAARVQFCFVGLGSALPFIRDGRMLALAVSTPARSPLLPEVPALAETLPDFGRDGSHSLLAPAGTPRAIREQIAREVRRILEMPDIRQNLEALGYHLAPTTPDEHERIVRAQIATFSEVARRVGLRQN